MRTLHIKLLRGLWSLKGQGMAIAMVIAIGVGMYVMALTALESLRETQSGFYHDQRFSDVFAELKRAPESVAERIAELPGIAVLDTRVRAPLHIRLSGFNESITGQALSIPDGRQPQLNRLYLRAGEMPETGRDDQVLVSEAFAEAHALVPGDSLDVVINGRFRQLRISGIVLSPEFIYQIRPGDLFPDFARYALIWMNRSALAAAFNMEGAFNDMVIRLAPSASADGVIAQLDPILEPWGGLGAYGRDDQMSHRYLDEELAQLETMARVLPLIFIAVAAFLLNVVSARLIRTQREQIAVLKAFGYDNLTVAGHYLALIAVIVCIGALLGVLLGGWLASGLAGIYQDYFRFPWLHFRVRPQVALTGVVIAGGSALLGTVGALRMAFRLPPAQAMRPEAPTRYRRTLIERLGIGWLSQPSRMILRNLERQPLKSALSVIGIALAVAVMMLTGFQQGAIGHMLDVQFRLAQKQDLTVSFSDPVGYSALYSLRNLPGVYHVEGFRAVPATLRNGHYRYRGALQGFEHPANLFQVLDATLNPIRLPPEGVLLTDHLANLLEIKPGDLLQVQVLDGRRPELEIPVVGIVTEYIGVGAYLSRDYLSRLLGEGPSYSGAFMAAEAEQLERLQHELEGMPKVLGVALRASNIDAFHRLMDETILVFTLFSVLMAGCIAFAVVYNNARIAFAERGRELASLRVLGFTRAETAFILLGELMLLTLLALIPGFVIGAGLCWLLTWGMQTDLYRIPLVLTPRTYAMATLVVLLATLLSASLIWRKLVRLDMIAALKAPE